MTEAKAFFEAVKRGDLPAVRSTLSQNPALLDFTNESGQSAFLLAKYYRQEDAASYLLSLNPKLDIYNACAAGKTEDVTAALKANPDLLESHSGDGWTPLHLAAFFGQEDITSALLEAGANVDARSTNRMQNTPLHAAAAGQKLALMKMLLEHGAWVDARQEGGWTALHTAAQSGNREMLELLIAKGADVHARAENGQNALDLAMLHGKSEIASLLHELQC
jgi:uncharacterized protein